jgi:pantothenate kinase
VSVAQEGSGPSLDGALVERARSLAAEGRAVLGVAGAPGSGKTTLAGLLVEAVGPAAVALPMDGFHLHDVELARLGRSDRKGAPDTFDVAGYVALLQRIRHETDHVVYAPGFDRSREECIAGAIAVRPEHRLVVTEGNYLLLPSAGWGAVRPLLDEAWFVEADEAVRLERLVRRHVAHGKPPELAERWAFETDQANADLVATTRAAADLVVPVA